MPTSKSSSGRQLESGSAVICQYQRKLRDDCNAASSRSKAASENIGGWETTRGYKLCTLSAVEKTLDFYTAIDNYELFDALRSAEIIKTNVEKHIKTDDELGKAIDEAAKLLNEVKTKLLDANNAACSMHNCLQSIIAFKDGEPPDQLAKVTRMAKDLSTDSREAAKALVTIAGIHTFAKITSLKEHAEALPKLIKELKTITDGYVKKATDQQKKTQTELTEIIDELNSAEFLQFGETSTVRGLAATKAFICQGPCPPFGQIEEICNELTRAESGSPGQETFESGKPNEN